MDVNGARTQDIKRFKEDSHSPSSENLKKKEETNSLDSKGRNGVGISLIHKALEDSPFCLDGDPSYGLYLTAKRDLKAGELLFDDTPAFFGPSADLVEDYNTPLCLGCCVVMNDGNNENRCEVCNWPICVPDCDNIELHRNNECQLFVKEKVTFPPNLEIQPCYKSIAIIRGVLLKEKDPKLWDQLMTLQWETQLQLTPTPDIQNIKDNFGLSDFGNEEDWLRILGIINVNSYSFQRVEKKLGSPSFGECLFPIYSLMCHSCTPNCTWAITYSPSFIMKVRPTVDIKKGDMLRVCYNHEYSKFGFHKRQEKIRERAEFECKCERCKDPSDLGTFLAAVKCFKCEGGYMLPECSDDYEKADWKCDKCPYTMCSSFITSFVESLYEISDMAEDEAEETGEPVVNIFEKFLASNAGVKVHPNHWVIAEASKAILKLQTERLVELGVEEVQRYIELCRYLLKLRDILAPGFSNERGMLHHYLARGLYRKLELSNFNSKETELNMTLIQNVQEYALRFWKENPHYEDLPESYRREPELLMKEANNIKAKILN